MGLRGFNDLDKNKISIRSFKLLQTLLKENPRLKQIMDAANSLDEVHNELTDWVYEALGKDSLGIQFYENQATGYKSLKKLNWKEVAGIRILDYIANTGKVIEDANLKNAKTINQPFNILWQAVKNARGGANKDFFFDMIALFRQFNGLLKQNKPSNEQVLEWMDRHPAGTDCDIAAIRKENKERIIKVIVKKIADGSWNSTRYNFPDTCGEEEQVALVTQWWDEWAFHLKFAIRDPETMNEMLDYSLMPDTIDILYKAQKVGIPFFVNPYYLSLLNIREYDKYPGADKSIRDYVFYSRSLIEQFGKIIAWEKEDIVKEGEPNAAGWMVPGGHNIHRRYPEVAILIPDTVGRACGGLCVSCQRMYDFQSGHLNFDLDKLKPNETWNEKLQRLMDYYENDSQLRDILITGGDALMNSDKSLKKILDEVYAMAVRKREANKNRANGEKFAEMVRIRLGTRLPVYLPQRITENLAGILAEFKEKASKIGFKQFVIQTHFITAMEITPEASRGIQLLNQAGWMVTNQMVFTTAGARRGHTAKLRKVLNDNGVVSYYTFSVKGFMENNRNFATNARAIQESMEEKVIGTIPESELGKIKEFPIDAEHITDKINALREKANLPFLATDRNVLNIPGVGKSLTFRTVGITRYGRRILEFDHDATRSHSPILEKMGKFVAVESKSMNQFLKQLNKYGEDMSEYDSVFGYSIGETEQRMSIYEYPTYDFETTNEYTNLEI
jgi:lysine 2,3-aminomutase